MRVVFTAVTLLTKGQRLFRIRLIMSRNLKENNRAPSHSMTSQRRLLLQLLRDAGRHIDAKELYRGANARDDSIGIATVYRSLSLFEELSLVEKVKLGDSRYYDIKQSPGHQHLVCSGCGKVIEFRSTYFDKLMQAVQREYVFKVTESQLYLEGYCSECEKRGKN